MIIVPADPTSFAALDKLANESGMNVAVVNAKTRQAPWPRWTLSANTLD